MVITEYGREKVPNPYNEDLIIVITFNAWLITMTKESIQSTALSQSSGATTLTLKKTHSLSVSSFPHSNYDWNTLGICGTSWLSVS